MDDTNLINPDEETLSESISSESLHAKKKDIRWYHNVGDFFNCLKAFIGTNYQGLPFAFAQSGLAFGIVGVALIAFLNDHCIQLLVRSKNLVIQRICNDKYDNGEISEQERQRLEARLQQSLSYADLGKHALGIGAYHVIMLAIWFTQFMTIISYFIFIGNTIFEIFPMVPRSALIENATYVNDNSLNSKAYSDRMGLGIPILSIPNIGKLRNDYASSDLVWFDNYVNDGSVNFHDNNETRLETVSQKFLNPAYLTQEKPIWSVNSLQNDLKDSDDVETTNIFSSPLPTSADVTVRPDIDKVSTAPDLRLIMLFPLPFFLLTSLIRKMRYLAPFSSISTVALAIGVFSVLGFIIAYFKISPFSYWKLRSLPLFLGQLISAYEGIGCVIPIQSSMEGNRHLFPWFVHGAVSTVFVILSTFGILGYLSFGENVSQIIVTNIPQHSVLSIMVDVTLIISVLFTYPLQCFPVIEIMETYLFSTDNCCSSNRCSHSAVSTGASLDYEELDEDVMERSIEMSASQVSHIVPNEIPTWKRNIVRVVITLAAVALAIVLKDSYAYLNAFTGALGASLLAFIFPCLIHLALKWNNLSKANLIKDYSIIAFAGVSSIMTIIVIIYTMAVSGNH